MLSSPFCLLLLLTVVSISHAVGEFDHFVAAPDYHQSHQNEVHQEIHEYPHHEEAYPTAPPSYQENTSPPPTPSPSASSCLSRIRLAASFDPSISVQINRFIDSMRIDRLRSYVCEKTAYFCDEAQQREVGEMFRQFDRSVDIIDHVRHQLTSTEKDQLNMMENLNDTLAEQAFFVYKFHQLNPVDLAILQSAKSSLTSALSSNTPDPSLSKAMGSFSPHDLERIKALPLSSFPEEVRSHLARCQITSPEVIHDTVSFLLAIMGSKQSSYRT